MQTILLVLVIVFNVLSQSCSKIFSDRYGNHFLSTYLFGAVWMGLAGIAYFIWDFSINGFTNFTLDLLLISIPNAFCLVGATLFSILAFKQGPMSLVILFSSFAVIIPVLLGPILFNESISTIQIISILLLLLSIFVIVYTKNTNSRKLSPVYIFYLFLTFVTNGGIMIFQKYQPIRLPNCSIMSFSSLSFLFGSIIYLVLMSISLLRKNKFEPITMRYFVLPCIGSGVFLSAVNQLCIVLTTMMPAAIQFPVQAGGLLIVSTIVSAVFFNEKFTTKKLIGMAIGIAGIILINL